MSKKNIPITLLVGFLFSINSFASAKHDAKLAETKKVAEKTAQVKPMIVIETSMGTMEAELYPSKAPITVKNFLAYIKAKHFDGLIFHRVIPNFMIQGGGFDAKMKQKKGLAPIKLETQMGLSNVKGTLAMARTDDPNSATSQFFINNKTNTFLDGKTKKDGYAVFGKLTKGEDVLMKISAVKTGNKNGHANVPLKPVTIKTITLKK